MKNGKPIISQSHGLKTFEEERDAYERAQKESQALLDDIEKEELMKIKKSKKKKEKKIKHRLKR